MRVTITKTQISRTQIIRERPRGGALVLRIDGGVPPRKMAKIFSETCNVQKDTHSGTSSQRKYTLMET